MISKIEFDFTVSETPIGIEMINNGEKWRGYFAESAVEQLGELLGKNNAGVIVLAFHELKQN